MKTPSFLREIGKLTEERIQERMKVASIDFLKSTIPSLAHKIIPFESLLAQKEKPLIIAEIKKSSPSLGLINHQIEAPQLGFSYFHQGAMAISVLTEPKYFGGDIETILKIRESSQDVPILQKDFVISPYQIYEARVLGADCVLLIVALLGEEKTREFLSIAKSLGLSALVEVHNEEELEIALKLDASIVGINNRNLHSLEISLDTSRNLIKQVQKDIYLISESGIENSGQIKELQALGYDAFLIGSSLMKYPDPSLRLQELLQGARLT